MAEANCALGALGPGEESDEGAGGTLGVAVIEVVRGWVVVVDGDFDEAEAEDSGVEVDVALGVTAHGGDVVDALDAVAHDLYYETNRFVVRKGLGLNDWQSTDRNSAIGYRNR